MTTRPRAPAAERNSPAILEVLRREFSDRESVLEIGSGTGQHAVCFAKELPSVTWQTSDLADGHAGINAWIEHAGTANVLAPLLLDVLHSNPPASEYDAVFSANTAHIMSPAAVERMFVIVGECLRPGGRFCLYGPFSEHGRFSTESNAAFDRSLRSQDPEMGIRDLDALNSIAADNGLRELRRYAMPANNLLVVWEKTERSR